MKCNNELHKNGLPMPRTCAKCGLGNCTEYTTIGGVTYDTSAPLVMTMPGFDHTSNKTLEYKIMPQGVPIKFKPTGFRVENEGSITVDISIDPENEVGCPQYLLVEQDGDTLAVTKDCLYQLYLAACELQK